MFTHPKNLFNVNIRKKSINRLSSLAVKMTCVTKGWSHLCMFHLFPKVMDSRVINSYSLNSCDDYYFHVYQYSSISLILLFIFCNTKIPYYDPSLHVIFTLSEDDLRRKYKMSFPELRGSLRLLFKIEIE